MHFQIGYQELVILPCMKFICVNKNVWCSFHACLKHRLHCQTYIFSHLLCRALRACASPKSAAHHLLQALQDHVHILVGDAGEAGLLILLDIISSDFTYDLECFHQPSSVLSPGHKCSTVPMLYLSFLYPPICLLHVLKPTGQVQLTANVLRPHHFRRCCHTRSTTSGGGSH